MDEQLYATGDLTIGYVILACTESLQYTEFAASPHCADKRPSWS